MKQVIWTGQAVEDVEAIKAYVGHLSIPVAASFAAKIVAIVGGLDSSCDSGRLAPEFGDDSFRELVFRSYRIVFRIQEQSVQVLLVYDETLFHRM